MIIYIYRTQIFNLLVEYNPEHQIETIKITDSYWTAKVDKIIASNAYDGMPELNDLIVKLIASKLQFGKNQEVKSPNNFRQGSIAHCVGYSALHASLLTYAINKIDSSSYKISHIRGKIKFLGYSLTSNQNGSFYKDHDFVKIENISINKHYYSDAALYEYFKISRINLKYSL